MVLDDLKYPFLTMRSRGPTRRLIPNIFIHYPSICSPYSQFTSYSSSFNTTQSSWFWFRNFYMEQESGPWLEGRNEHSPRHFIVLRFRPLRLLSVQLLYEGNSREKLGEVVEDKKKPFDAEISTDQWNGRVWHVKVREPHLKRPSMYPRNIGPQIPNGTLGVYQCGTSE